MERLTTDREEDAMPLLPVDATPEQRAEASRLKARLIGEINRLRGKRKQR
jgi:hypothetical protein